MRFVSNAALAMLILLVFQGPVRSAEPAGVEPCCNITAIDARTGVVTARDVTSKRTFQFKANSRALLRSLKVGQKVYANLGTQKVSIDGMEPCCGIVGMQTVPSVAGAGPVAAAGQAMQSAGSEDPLGGSGKPGSGRKVKVAPRGNDSEGQSCKDRGGEWRCTTIATGSNPGPEDDTISCSCIFSGLPK